MSIVAAPPSALIYLAAGFPATSGGMTIGTLVAFHQPAGEGIFRPLMALLNVGVSWISSMALFKRGSSWPRPGDRCARAGRARPAACRRCEGDIRFDHVSFTYAEGAPPRSTT
ncbi:MAG: hypothetical protein U0Q10_06485 [Dermatophilaceae bacterium]